jgi:hypothetical protein
MHPLEVAKRRSSCFGPGATVRVPLTVGPATRQPFDFPVDVEACASVETGDAE